MGAVDLAKDGLCRMIASGELQPGQALPSEAELCEQFGVSRSSLRESQRMLAVAGVLASRRGGRSFVSEMNPEQILSGLDIVVPLLPLARYLEMFPLREVLEGHAAALAAARMTAEEADDLQRLAEELSRATQPDLVQQLDMEFHTSIFQGAGDEMIAALLASLRKRGQDYRIIDLGDARGTEMKGISDQAHRRIAAAIVDRDPETARSQAAQHVRETKGWLEGIRPEPSIS
ncbi:MAG: FadR/GntR family transcriptional regulator [Arachnia sp.]